MKTWDAVRGQIGLPARSWLPVLFAPLAAILLPLQTNFEHQNMNALLLALLAGATWQLTLGSAAVAGLLIGMATALKAFPALAIVYLAARRYWTAASAAMASALVLSVVMPAAVYGASGFSDLARTFWRLGNSGWPIRGNNQSLVAALDRFTLGPSSVSVDSAGVRIGAEAPLAIILFAALAVLLVAAFVVILVRTPRRASAVPAEVGAVTVLAILLSPIAWDHYWTMMFPAFLIVHDSRDDRLLGRPGAYAFWTAAVLTTGLSPLTLGKSGFNLARDWSVYTIAALIVYACLMVVCGRSEPPSREKRAANG
jgi:alpha-1,2-mannosyltransferase